MCEMARQGGDRSAPEAAPLGESRRLNTATAPQAGITLCWVCSSPSPRCPWETPAAAIADPRLGATDSKRVYCAADITQIFSDAAECRLILRGYICGILRVHT